MQEKTYLLVDADVLPEVFIRVLRAKELLAGGEARNVSQAAKMANVSRSAFYKYKDCVLRPASQGSTVTLTATLLDENGALQTLLAGISDKGGSIVTINQSVPENGTAKVAVTLRTGGLRCSLGELCAELRRLRAVVEIGQNG